MILEMYAILDKVGGFYSNPFFMASHGLARRALMETAQDMSTTVARHPADFALYYFGSMDNVTGRFELNNHPEFLCTAISLLQGTTQPDLLQEGV